MDTPKNRTKISDKERKLRNSPILFEFYRSLTALNVVLVEYVQGGKHHLKAGEADREVEAYAAKQTGVEERAAKATKDIQELLSQYMNGNGCGPGETWDPATKTCG